MDDQIVSVVNNHSNYFNISTFKHFGIQHLLMQAIQYMVASVRLSPRSLRNLAWASLMHAHPVEPE